MPSSMHPSPQLPLPSPTAQPSHSAQPSPSALPWPRWNGADLAPARALLVLAGPDLAANLARADAFATLAARGIRVLLRLSAPQADWLARVWGVWAVWPVESAGDEPAEPAEPADPDPDAAPADLIGAVDAWIPLADLDALLPPVADGPWPRLHLGAAYVTSLFDEADAQGQPERAETLWIGTCLDDDVPDTTGEPGPTGAQAIALLDGLAERLQVCTWHWREPAPGLEGSAHARRLGRWPDLHAPGTDRLLLARRIATLDLLVTHHPEAATLAWALGKSVWWLASPAVPGDPHGVDALPPAHLGSIPVVTLQDLPGALAAWAPPRRHALRRLSPDDALAGVVEAINACQQGALDAACEHALQLLISHPQRPDAWRLLGLIGQTTGRPDWAERCHARVTEVAPAWPDGWKSLGLLRVELDRRDPAIDALTRALALAPQDAAVRGPLARLHEQRRDTDIAIALYREGLGHQPAETDWQLALGQLLVEAGEPEAALSYLDTCLRQLDAAHPGHARALRLSARAHAARGDTDAASACLRRCLARRPDDAQAAATLARLYRHAGLNTRSRELLRVALRAAPDEAVRSTDRAWLDLEAWWALRLSDPAVAPDDIQAVDAARVLAADPRAERPDTTLWCALAPLLDAETRAALRPVDAGRSPDTADPAPERRALTSRRPRLAYVGSPTALLRHQDRLRALLARHDRSRLDVQVWHWSAPQDDGRVDTPAGLDAQDLGAGSDAELARQVLSLEPDALVDLDGDGCHARPGLWARLPGGLRLAAFDRREGVGLEHGEPWSITLACAGPADALQASSPLRARWRVRLGLPAKAPVLACLAPLEALSPSAFEPLFALLRACPPAHLWLAPADLSQRTALGERARSAGIAADRLHHLDAEPHAHALRRGALSAVDLYLQFAPDWHDGVLPDPLAQALAAAVPVQALGGEVDPCGRVRALLHAAGTARDVLHADATAWLQAALAALRQPRELLAQRQQAVAGHRSAALFQTAAVVQHLQDALLSDASPPKSASRNASKSALRTASRTAPNSAPKTTTNGEISDTRATPRHPQERRDPSPA